jgi:hypothetical protein
MAGKTKKVDSVENKIQKVVSKDYEKIMRPVTAYVIF